MSGVTATTRSMIARTLDMIRAAARKGERSPSNLTIASALGLAATAPVVRYIQIAEADGLIIVHRGNSARVIAAADGSWQTAGTVERKHWRDRSPEERGRAPDTRRGKRAPLDPQRQKGAAGFARALAQSTPPRLAVAPPARPVPRVVPGLGWGADRRGCQWPMWRDDDAPTHVFCDAPRETICRPYCAAHARLSRPGSAEAA